MLERIEQVAQFTVSKACGFGLLGGLTLMTGLSGDMTIAMRAGGFLALIACFILMSCAWNAPTKPYKRTEVWLLLPTADRPTAEVAQQIIGGVMRETLFRFALHAAWLGLGMLLASLLFGSMTRPGS